ncbi:unnamed protein product [Effrenium voratum]|uniref:Mei2-like C-terminal RNA recognition motif domain-containing protein n=1 Tax=Effrenium voratum TaxID=2562239 RepID=A0AA36JLI5_9DINO|nr:unnamed protein product [Effrenium voratum]
MAEMLRLPTLAEDAGTDKVVVKKTFIEVVEDLTPKGLPPTYNSDSVITSRFGRQLSGKSIVDEEPVELDDVFEASECDEEDTARPERPAECTDEELPTLLGGRPAEEAGPKRLLISSFLRSEEGLGHHAVEPQEMYRRSLDLLVQQYAAMATAAGGSSSSGRQPRTTVMLRNLPNNYTRTMVCTMMDKEGFKGQYDFLYLPIDFRSKANLGYAFVNLVNELQVQAFWKVFDGYTRWVLPSAKVCSVSWSGPHQGQQAHVDRYKDSPIMHSSVPDEFKPVIFAGGSGERMPFPAPSKKLRAPRRRPGQGHGNDSKPG